jgi:pimeloyl-ACP methyl ester carboxylesterase
LRGHGLSDKPHDPAQYGVEMVNDVVRLMDHLGIAKAHVVGYSMGGFITLKLLTMYPERLLSAAPCAAGWGKLDAQNSKLIDDVASSLESGEGMAPLFRRLEPNGKEPPRLRVLFMNFLLGHMNDEKALAAAMRGFPALAITEEQLRANKVPVLSIVGSADPLKEGVDALTGVLSNHEVIVIKGGDHMTTISNPGFIQGLRDFLTRHAAGANAPTETAAPAGGLTESPNAV